MNASPGSPSAKKSDDAVLTKYGVDTRDFPRAEERVQQLLQGDLRNNDDASAELRQCWDKHVKIVGDSFAERFMTITNELDDAGRPEALPGERRAELLSGWSSLAKKYTAHAPDKFPIPEPDRVVAILCTCVSSASVTIRVLGYNAAKCMSRDMPFLTEFFASTAHFALATAFDSENEAETEHALNFVATVVEQAMLRRKESFDRLPMAIDLQDRLCASPRTARGGGGFRFHPSLPFGLIMRLVTMLDYTDTRLQAISAHRKHQVLVLLKDILLLWPLPATAASTIRTLLTACLHGNLTREQTDLVLDAILSMYDSPTYRRYFRHSDLHVLFAPFMELDAKDSVTAVAAMNHAKDLLCRLMCSWPGLLWVATEGMNLRALVDLLHLPGPLDNKMVLITFFNALLRRCAPLRGIPTQGPWNGAAAERKRATTAAPDGYDLLDSEDIRNSSFDSTVSSMQFDASGGGIGDDDDGIPTTKAVGYNALDPFLGALLIVLDRAGLARALMTLLGRAAADATTGVLVPEAATLLQHLLVLMDTVLPTVHAAGLHEALSAEVARLSQSANALHVTMKLFSDFTSSNRAQRIEAQFAMPLTVAAGGGGGVSQLTMDEAQFQQLLRDSLVESFNEHTKWNFDMLMILVQGPLRNVARLRWARDNTRFFARVLTFYKPSSNRASFCSMSRGEVSPSVVGFGVALIDVLLSTRDGVEILEKAEMLKAFRGAYQEVLEKRESIFTKERLSQTTTSELFRLFGRFSATAHGLLLMLKHNVFGTLQQLFEEASKLQAASTLVDITHRTLQHLYLETVPNFGVCIEARLILKMALSCPVNIIRLCGVMQLKRVMWRDLSSSLQWGIQRILECINGTTLVVVEHSFRLLTSICASSAEALDHLIAQEPAALLTNPVLNENQRRLNTAALLFRILGRPAGFKFLMQNKWTEKQLAAWTATEAILFVDEMDKLLVSGLQAEEAATKRTKSNHARTYSDSISSRSSPQHRPRGVSISSAVQTTSTLFPLHFVGELCRTEDGCALFAASAMYHEAVALVNDCTEANDALLTNNNSNLESGLIAFNLAGGTGFSAPDEMAGSLIDFDATYTGGGGGPGMRGSPATAFLMSDNSFDLPVRTSRMNNDDVAEDLADLLEMEELHQAARQLRRNNGDTNAAAGGGAAAGGDDDGDSSNSEPHSALLLSACRGYTTAMTNKLVGCHGDIKKLRAAIFTLAHVCCSDVGMAHMESQQQGILARLMDLARYASHPTVRGTAVVAMTLLARCPKGVAYLEKHKYSVVSAETAYVSSIGVPFSVAFCHPRNSATWTTLPPVPHLGHTPSQARRQIAAANAVAANAKFAPLMEHVKGLSNPVTREGCKQKLYLAFKQDAAPFCDPLFVHAIQAVLGAHRMRHVERKFVADLMSHARVAEMQRRRQLHAMRAASSAASTPPPQPAATST